jgi:signal transduction histidine kinase
MRGATATVLLLVATVFFAASGAAQDNHKRVLVLHSFGRDFGPYTDVASAFETELARQWPGTVEFYEASLETARFSGATNEAPLVGYLEELFSQQPMDLLVSVGGPAAQFCLRQRESLFPETPFLATGVERRWVARFPEAGHAAAVPVALDLPAAIENILRVLPETKEILVVLGGSSLSNLWLAEMKGEFARFDDRVRLTWTNEWSLEELEKRAADLPPGTAIFFGELSVDAAGVPHRRHTALERLHAVSTAPIFGLFDTQLGRGIVGGPLLSLSESGRQAASAALRILGGEAIDGLDAAPTTMSLLAYDYRELERFRIKVSRLPPGSEIRFEPPSVWDEYRWPLLIGLGVVGLQAALIGGLLVQHSRRKTAEEEAHALAQRLLTAHEDERRRLARELHDDLSQRLATLGLDVARMERSLSDTPQKESARAVRADLVRLSEDVHDLSYQLHPSVLDELGLKNALEVECERFSRRESIPAELTSFEAPPVLSKEVSVCLFRVAQEALRNVARHARANEVSVTVLPRNGSVSMVVRDDGVGFDSARRRSRQSLGHASMRERARLLHGTVEVESAPGRGTTVRISVPLKEEVR